MSRADETTRIGFYLDNDLLEECDACWKAYEFPSRNTFVNEAIRHYIDTMRMRTLDDELIERLGAAIAKASDDNAVKISKGLFRYAVGQEMILCMLAKLYGLDAFDVAQLRRRAIRDVRRTRGRVNLEAIADFQNEEEARLIQSESMREDNDGEYYIDIEDE